MATTILFLEDTRRIGIAGFTLCILVMGLSWHFGWPPESGEVFWLLFSGGAAGVYLYLIVIHRRRVVTLIDRQIIWNTYGFKVPPLTVSVTDVHAYRMEEIFDPHLYRSAVLLSTGWQKVGDFPKEVHRRIFLALQALHPNLRWEERDYMGNEKPSGNRSGRRVETLR